MDNNKLDTITNLFEGKEIRSIWDSEKEEYFFSVIDIISALTESNDSAHYWRTLKSRMIQEGNQTVTNCDTFKLKAKDGKMRNTDMLDTQNILRLIESIPSPKAEPFKMWLAGLGNERINEVFDPELAIDRAVNYYNSIACYLKKDNKVLMIKFAKKWGNVYAPPGGKFEIGETPLDCITREYYEETGLTLINPRLQGISYWKDSKEGIIFIYTAEDFTGDIKTVSEEGTLKWIKLDDLNNIRQFEQNEKFIPYLFKDELFEGKFLLDDKCKVIDYKIRNM